MSLCITAALRKWFAAKGVTSKSANAGLRTTWDVPQDSGLLLTLSAGTCWAKIVKDAHVSDLHPNAHVPASLKDSVQAVGGGGSGVTVMKAVDPTFGRVVLKHGAHKDVEELFALATIEKELRSRGEAVGSTDAATDLVQRTPDFEYIYISHAHLCAASLKRARTLPISSSLRRSEGSSRRALSVQKRCTMQPRDPSVAKMKGIRICDLSYQQQKHGEHREKVRVIGGFLEVYLDVDSEVHSVHGIRCSAAGEGYAYLQNFVHNFIPLQESHGWKVTLAQKAVGDDSSQTASALLSKSMLSEGRLTTLLDEMIKVIHNLDILTLPEERNMVDQIRNELKAMEHEKHCDISQMSDLSDMYVGRAMKKNFDLENGRFKQLREFGEEFREGSFILTEAEALPAENLGFLLERGSRLEEVFENCAGPTALDTYSDAWHEILIRATTLQGSKALTSIWTGGLTDGGIHNLFLDEDCVWLFDMGNPCLVSLPALLTKFLFSFLHTLGMEEVAGDGDWVNRFLPGEVIDLTIETKNLLPQAREAFTVAVERFVAEVFNGEQAVRELLIEYAVLQLISDCAFCLARWEEKGGGSGRSGLEKWLWRAMWDMYIASEVANGSVKTDRQQC